MTLDNEATEFSFGGIKDRGVPTAVEKVVSAIKNGAKWYVRSDIAEFFTKIPRQSVLTQIGKWIRDDDFNRLLGEALTIELQNLSQLGMEANEFPIHSIGVAQGCCLSPLVGNLLLFDFDKKMNGRGLNCIRYIDDFIILAKDRSKVVKGFESALRHLQTHNLEAYDPFVNSDKAKSGQIVNGIDFLGCVIKPNSIRPNSNSVRRLLEKTRLRINEGKSDLLSIKAKADYNRNQSSYIQTLKDVDSILHGWGNTYYFCTDRLYWKQLDEKINRHIDSFNEFYHRLAEQIDDKQTKRRLLGVHLILDSKYDPIELAHKNNGGQ